jgi:O-antigen/teichoic acid export membrane protein
MKLDTFNQARLLIVDALNVREKESLRTYLFRGVLGIIALRVIVQAVYFLTNLVLAHLLGVKEYGSVEYIMSWAALFGTLALFGLERLLVREIAINQARLAWGLLKGLIRWATWFTLLTSIILILGIVGVLFLKRESIDNTLLLGLGIATLLIPFNALTGVRVAILRGLRKVIAGQSTEVLIQPVVFLLFVLSASFLFRLTLNAPLVLGLQVGAAVVVFLIGQILLYQRLPQEIQGVPFESNARFWISSLVPLVAFSAISVINKRADILVLGTLRGTEEVGIYSVAASWAALVPYALVSINIVWAPVMARLYEKGEKERLQRMITQGTRGITFVSLIFAFVFLVLGKWLLSLYGPDFVEGETALRILVIGQLVNVAVGPVAQLLLMTGYERVAAINAGFNLVLTIGLNFVLVPRWGVEGTAWATSVSMILINLLLTVWVYKRLDIHSTVLGNIGRIYLK